MLYRLKQLILFAGDVVALYFGLFLALSERYWGSARTPDSALLIPMTHLFLAAVIIMFVGGLYDVARARNHWKFYRKILIAALSWVAVGIIYFYLRPNLGLHPKTILLLTALNGFGLLSLWRYVHNRFLSATILKTSVVFAGVTPETLEIIHIIIKEPQRGYAVEAIVNPEAAPLPAELSSLPHHYTFAPALKPQIIVIAPRLRKDSVLMKEMYLQLFKQTTIIDLAEFYEEIFGRIPPFTFSETWFLRNLNEQRKKIYDRFRLFADYFVAAVMAVFFGLTFPFVALVIHYTSPGPIFFRQKRVGRGGQTFNVLKYRTMKALSPDGSAETDGARFAEQNDSRVTSVGRFLRRTRLDELPQFINILKNEMGAIGPRPERPEFVAELTRQMPFYSLRHLIKPGLTGWAQIKQSYYGSIEENLRKLEYDLYYIKHRGLWLDLAIILRTINTVLRMGGR